MNNLSGHHTKTVADSTENQGIPPWFFFAYRI